MLIVHIIRMYLSQNNFTEHALNNGFETTYSSVTLQS